MAKHVASVVLFGDTHCGGATALMPPKWVTMDGQTVYQSRAQAWIWERWMDFAGKVRDESRRVPVLGLLNGDPNEGAHHEMSQLLSPSTEDHALMAVEALDPVVCHCKAVLMTESTNAHGGKQSRTDNMMARIFAEQGKNIIKPDGPSYIWPVANVLYYGKRFNVAHHGRVSANERTRQNGANGEASDQVFEAMLSAHEQGMEAIVPDYICRNHAHRMSYGYFQRTNTHLLGAGCFQLSTSHGHKGFPHRPPDIGGWMIRIHDNGKTEHEQIRYPVLKEQRYYTEVHFGTHKTTAGGDTAGADIGRTKRNAGKRGSGRSGRRGASGDGQRIRGKAQDKQRSGATTN